MEIIIIIIFCKATHVIRNVYQPLHAGGSLVIAQEQDSIGGYFDDSQSFSGSVTQLEMWAEILNPTDIKKLASCAIETYDSSQRVVTWSNTSWDAFGNISSFNEKLEDLCQPSLLLNMVSKQKNSITQWIVLSLSCAPKTRQKLQKNLHIAPKISLVAATGSLLRGASEMRDRVRPGSQQKYIFPGLGKRQNNPHSG